MSKRQISLFGTFVKEKTKKYVIYKNPTGNYESYVERYCLRGLATNPHRDVQNLHIEAQTEWKRVANDTAAQEAFIQLRPNERPFVLYDKDGYQMRSSSARQSSINRAPYMCIAGPSNANDNSRLNKDEEQFEVVIIDTPEISSSKRPRMTSKCVPDATDVLSSNTEGNKDELSKVFNQNLTKNLCLKLCPDLISQDVINNDSFVDGIASYIKPIILYLERYSMYQSLKSRERKGTAAYLAIVSINQTIEEIKSTMYQASEIEINTTCGLPMIMASARQKEELLKIILTKIVELDKMIKCTNINNKLQKRITQVSSENKDKIKEAVHINMKLKCLNTSISWEKAYINAEGHSFSNNLLDLDAVISAASDIQAEFCIPVTRFKGCHRDELVNILLELFPIMLVKRMEVSVLVDVHELILQKDAFTLMLSTDDDIQEGEELVILEEQGQEADSGNEFIGPNNRIGRSPLYVKYPTLIDTATKFIKEHSFSAHVRRRESTGTGAGVTLQDIQKHLLENVPGLREGGGIHRDTIHRLTVAPRKNSTRAHRYKGLINARVPGKRNQYREDNENQHFLFARVSYREEFVSKFYSEAQFYSCDDMNKLRMGPATAVSRYHQIFRFFVTNDAPNLGDHDFPNAGYLIVPSGYMSLTASELKEEISEEYLNDELNDCIDNDIENEGDSNTDMTSDCHEGIFTFDKLGRKHYRKFSAGPSFVKLRACLFGQSSGMTHANDILRILAAQVKNGKGIAFLKVDNGSDWNIHSMVNIYYLGKVWKDSGLDVLGVVSYAARFSAYNNIEHLWSPLSKSLSTVILPSILDGESVEPCKQTLETTERREKEAIIFDNAMEMVTNKYWKEKEFNGSLITTAYKECLSEEFPYCDYKHIHGLLSGPETHLRGNKELVGEMSFFLKHLERKSNEIIFQKCSAPRCKYCPVNPIISTEAWEFLQQRDFKWPNPKPSLHFENHYTTFLELCELDSSQYNTANENLPCNLQTGTCPYCKSFVFLSDADRKKHMAVFHHDNKGDGNKIWKAKHRCLFVLKKKSGSTRCNLVFKSANQLREHKTQAKHLIVRKKKNESKKISAPSSSSSGKKKKEIQLENLFDTAPKITSLKPKRSAITITDSDEEEPEEEKDFEQEKECEVEKEYEDNENEDEVDVEDQIVCNICHMVEPIDEFEMDEVERNETTEWIQCCKRTCKEWYHLVCIDLYMSEKVATPKGKWFCCK